VTLMASSANSCTNRRYIGSNAGEVTCDTLYSVGNLVPAINVAVGTYLSEENMTEPVVTLGSNSLARQGVANEIGDSIRVNTQEFSLEEIVLSRRNSWSIR
jgi:hypothetical protein